MWFNGLAENNQMASVMLVGWWPTAIQQAGRWFGWERFCMASADVAAPVVRRRATGKFVTMGNSTNNNSCDKKARVALLKQIFTREIEPFHRCEIFSLNICSGQNKLLIIRRVCLVLQNGLLAAAIKWRARTGLGAVFTLDCRGAHCQPIVAMSLERLYGNRCLLTILLCAINKR